MDHGGCTNHNLVSIMEGFTVGASISFLVKVNDSGFLKNHNAWQWRMEKFCVNLDNKEEQHCESGEKEIMRYTLLVS